MSEAPLAGAPQPFRDVYCTLGKNGKIARPFMLDRYIFLCYYQGEIELMF